MTILDESRKRAGTTNRVICRGCNRDLQRTGKRWKWIKLNADGLCLACEQAEAEIKADRASTQEHS